MMMVAGYIPFKIIVDTIASWLSIPDQDGKIGMSETLDLSDYYQTGTPEWLLSVGDISYNDAEDIGDTPTVYEDTVFVSISDSDITWTPPDVASNRRWFIELILTDSEDTTESTDTELTLDVARNALWTDENDEALWTDKYGFPLWTE